MVEGQMSSCSRDTAQKAPVKLTRKDLRLGILRLGIQGQCQSDIAKQFCPL